jgi:zinc/manganese transport system substrate-binding protein
MKYRVKQKLIYLLCLLFLAPTLVSGCRAVNHINADVSKDIVVTYSILGSVVRDLVGDRAVVSVLIPNGQNAHEWEPSARDIEAVNNAGLVVQNGLGLESGLRHAIEIARQKGVPLFTATDYITARHIGAGEGIPGDDPDQAAGAADPHLWTDPVAMRDVVVALAAQLKARLNLNVDDRVAGLVSRLDGLNGELAAQASRLPDSHRRLVTGHESMGYFAARYGFKLIGAVVPGLTTEAEASAAELAALKQLIAENNVRAIFTELGTSAAVAEALGRETGARVIELATHVLPEDGSYFTFERNLMQSIITGLT